jgi:hypothetical protein
MNLMSDKNNKQEDSPHTKQCEECWYRKINGDNSWCFCRRSSILYRDGYAHVLHDNGRRRDVHSSPVSVVIPSIRAGGFGPGSALFLAITYISHRHV